MADGWSPERRAAQAEAIRRWSPWRQSTGPRSAEGKVRSSKNAGKGGVWLKERSEISQIRRLLREQRQALLRLVLR